jgi:hypothetical protein
MTERSVVSPPAALLHLGAAPPAVQTVVPEVRTNLTCNFCDPQQAPAEYRIDDTNFCGFVLWRVELSRADAQRVHEWLVNTPGSGIAPTGELALKGLIEQRLLENGVSFGTYLGTCLSCTSSSLVHTLIIGLRRPVTHRMYEQAWTDELQRLSAAPDPERTWSVELRDFLRLLRTQPGSVLEFLVMARDVNFRSLPSSNFLLP